MAAADERRGGSPGQTRPPGEGGAGSVPLPEVPGFHLVTLLGRGGMGEVYLARDEVLGRRVALKRLFAASSTTRDAHKERLLREEGRVLARLRHPNLLGVHGLVTAADGAYLVMELAGGGNLADRIRRRGPLPILEALALAIQVSRGLEAAWEEGIVHRDVKPSNLLLDTEGRIKVADFGLAGAHRAGKARDASAAPPGDSVFASPHYVSPELVRGETGDFRSDVYSLGIVLFEMLAGRPPFEGSDPMSLMSAHLTEALPDVREARPDVSRALSRWLQHMTHKKPARRPASYLAVLSGLEALGRQASAGGT